MKSPLLSICIPTKDRTQILRNTLESIYSSTDLNFEDFEVIISDNSENDDLIDVLNAYQKYSNVYYYKSQKKGFLNSIAALEYGKGKLLKLHNDYTMFQKNALRELIAFVKSVASTKPLVFFSQGQLKNITIHSYSNFDDFLINSSFWITWSTSFSIWQEDFFEIKGEKIDNVFPHTSLLLMQNKKEKFVINNITYFRNQGVATKGGYNLFHSFSVTFLNMIEHCKTSNLITPNTFKKIKSDLYYDFLIPWFYNTKIKRNTYTYDLTNLKRSICTYYSETEYKKLIFLAYMLPFKKTLNKIQSIFN